MLSRRLFACALGTLILTALPQMAEAAETLRIGWLKAPNDMTLAKARGTLEARLKPLGVDIEWIGPFAAAQPAMEALNAGAIDLTAGSSTATVTALAARMPIVVFGYQKMAATAEGIVVAKNSPMTAVADLVGKQVAVNRGGTGEYLLMRALERNHIDPASVTRVYLTPPDSGAAFASGTVAAWATWDPFLSLAERNYAGRVLADGAAVGSDNAVVWLASRKMVESRRALLQQVFDGLKADNAWAVAHPGDAGRIWAEAMNLPADLAPQIGARNAVPTRAPGAADAAQIGAIADWYLAMKIIPSRPDVSTATVTLTE